MKKLKLNNDTEIPMIGLGTFRNNDDKTTESLKIAIKNGYQMIDTAKVYENEESIKQIVTNNIIKRDEIWITSKVWTTEFTNIEEELDRALNATGLDYFDMYLLHWPRSYAENADAWKQMEAIYRSGKVKAIGVANFQIHHIDKLMETAEITPVINQVECHPNLPQYHLQNICEKYGIKLQSYCSFMKNEAKIVIDEIAKKHSVSSYQVILAWLIERQIIVIPMSKYESEMIENINSLNLQLDKDDLELIKKANKAVRYYPDPDNHKF